MRRCFILAGLTFMAANGPATGFAQAPAPTAPPRSEPTPMPGPMLSPMPARPPVPDPAMTTPGPAGQSPASKAYQAAMDRMMADMGRPFSGDADRDFVSGMLAHHQGAVEMAEIELQYGRDPAIKRLARQIVVTQQREIAEMRRWQAAHGGPPPR